MMDLFPEEEFLDPLDVFLGNGMKKGVSHRDFGFQKNPNQINIFIFNGCYQSTSIHWIHAVNIESLSEIGILLPAIYFNDP